MNKIKEFIKKNKGKIYLVIAGLILLFILSLLLPVTFGMLVFPFVLVWFIHYTKQVSNEPWIINEKEIEREIAKLQEDLKIIEEHLEEFPHDLDAKFRKQELLEKIEEIKKNNNF